MSSRIRAVVAGVAAVAVVAMVPIVWVHSTGATATPGVTPSPVVDVSVTPSPVVEPSPTPVVEEVPEPDYVAIADPMGMRRDYRNREEAEKLAAFLNERGVKAELREKEKGLETGFTFSTEGEGAEAALREYYWQRISQEESWSQARIDSHNAGVEEFAAFLRERGAEVEVHTTENGVKFHKEISFSSGGDLEDVKWEFLAAKGRVKIDENGQHTIIPTAEEMAEERTKLEALVEYLNSKGLEAKVGESDFGPWLDANLNDVDVLMAKEEFEWDELAMEPEQIENYNKHTEALAAYLVEHGVACEIKTNRYGLKYADYESSDEAEQLAEEFWNSYDPAG